MNKEDAPDQKLRATEFPDADAKRRLGALVGVESTTGPLLKDLLITLRPQELERWMRRHKQTVPALELVKKRPPLYILAGDVGTGKTEIAETIGDAVARELNIPLTLYRLGLGARGSGLVGEMSRLIAAGFEEVAAAARKWKSDAHGARAGAILFIDEADALAQSRELSQMHHEDRAGVNTLIRGIDDLAREELPVAVILATNRLSSLDPAVRRRAARTFELARPDAKRRAELFKRYLGRLVDAPHDLENLVQLTGPSAQQPYGFTYSDITQRLLPDAIMDAFPETAFGLQNVTNVLRGLSATPPFHDER